MAILTIYSSDGKLISSLNDSVYSELPGKEGEALKRIWEKSDVFSHRITRTHTRKFSKLSRLDIFIYLKEGEKRSFLSSEVTAEDESKSIFQLPIWLQSIIGVKEEIDILKAFLKQESFK
ncbi:MAG: hypothetical protein PHY72_03780 [Candidatus Pacebacteria bacterium]|nr:hypothetical protein [Candidatus Paceibacterota bacterium]